MEIVPRPHWRQYTFSFQGLKLAAQEHGPEHAPVIVALHGWRDNSASFIALAELMPEWRIIALDFPGHGLSDKRDKQSDYYLWSYVEDVLQLVQSLELDSFVLLGHSMGAAVANMFAAMYPEKVKALVMLDMVGPIVTPPEAVVEQMLKAAQLRKTRKLDYRNHYPSFADAVTARQSKGLCANASRLLAERGVEQDEAGFYWSLDQRLNMPNPISLTEEQARAFLIKNVCPVLLIAAPEFWLDRQHWFNTRMSYFSKLEVHMLEGGHHQHMEAHSADVAALCESFLLKHIEGTSE